MKWKSDSGVVLAFIFVLFLITGCYTVPETGRATLNIVPEGQVSRLALASFNKMKGEGNISEDTEMIDRVNRVGRRIAESVGEDLPKADWEFVVFDDDEMINAFALPGGKVGIYSGLFKIATIDSMLAVVMGHEIAHVVARYSNQRISRDILVQLLAIGVDSAMKDSSVRSRRTVNSAIRTGATFGYQMPFSRLSEREADHIGLIYLARAGYDPVASLEFWRRMEETKSGEEPPEFLSTHPLGEKRREQLLELMSLALEEYKIALQKGKVR